MSMGMTVRVYRNDVQFIGMMVRSGSLLCLFLWVDLLR